MKIGDLLWCGRGRDFVYLAVFLGKSDSGMGKLLRIRSNDFYFPVGQVGSFDLDSGWAKVLE